MNERKKLNIYIYTVYTNTLYVTMFVRYKLKLFFSEMLAAPQNLGIEYAVSYTGFPIFFFHTSKLCSIKYDKWYTLYNIFYVSSTYQLLPI